MKYWSAFLLPVAPLLFLVLIITLACLLSFGLLGFTADVLAFDKVISKVTQILLILSIFPLKKLLQFTWSDLGFAPTKLFFTQLGQGLLLSLITLLPVLFSLYSLNVHVWDAGQHWTWGKILGKLGLGLFLSLLIALTEEVLFRGLLLTAMRKYIKLSWAIIISAFYYAALHFLKSKTVIPYSEITLLSSFQLMSEAFANWLNPAIFSAWLALFVVGVFLATMRTQIPQSLGLCIGCHCGWVWQIKTSKDLCNVNDQSDYLFLVSNYDGVVGPLVAFWLALALWFLYFNIHKQKLKTRLS